MRTDWEIIVVGSGNAALCAALAAKERGRDVLVIEKALIAPKCLADMRRSRMRVGAWEIARPSAAGPGGATE